MSKTAAQLLSYMSGFNNELDTVEDGEDETRALLALNMATDYLEAVAASLPRVLSSIGDNPIHTAAQHESTPFPSDLIRLDKLWALDSNGMQLWPLDPIPAPGGQSPSLPWPLNMVVGNGQGQPRQYYADDSAIYWAPLPDAAYAVRAYGMWSRPDLEDRAAAFRFPDSLALPLAAFAVKYCLIAIDDPVDAISQVAGETFTPVLRALRKRDRSAAKSRIYDHVHST